MASSVPTRTQKSGDSLKESPAHHRVPNLPTGSLKSQTHPKNPWNISSSKDKVKDVTKLPVIPLKVLSTSKNHYSTSGTRESRTSLKESSVADHKNPNSNAAGSSTSKFHSKIPLKATSSATEVKDKMKPPVILVKGNLNTAKNTASVSGTQETRISMIRPSAKRVVEMTELPEGFSLWLRDDLYDDPSKPVIQPKQKAQPKRKHTQ